MISTIIVNYRAAELTIRAVESLYTSARDEPIEILLVDNSESREQADRLKRQLGRQCQVLISKRNIGLGAACNQAYAQAQGEWIVLLSPSSRFTPRSVQTLYEFLKANNKVGAVGPRVFWDDAQKLLLPAPALPNPREPLIHDPRGRLAAIFSWQQSLAARQQAIEYWKIRWPFQQELLSSDHVMLRREAVEKAGGLFNTQLAPGDETRDLFVRLKQRAGYHTYLVPDAIVMHNDANNPLQTQHTFPHEKPDMLTKLFTWLQHGAPWLPRINDLGTLDKPLLLPVPSSVRDYWLLECSATPFFMQAAGMFGRGVQAKIPAETWRTLPPGEYFLRLGHPGHFYLPPTVMRFQK